MSSSTATVMEVTQALSVGSGPGAKVAGRSRLSKTGNARLRHALYVPALSGWRWNPRLADFAARLLAKGKLKMQVLGALMHKLLALACGVLKTRQPFDPLWLAPKQTPARSFPKITP